jgi:hypothetical protein
MSDLIDRLRAVPFVGFIYEGQAGQEDPSICTEAADEIARLRDALEELEKCIAEHGFPYDGHMLTTVRAALAEGKTNE